MVERNYYYLLSSLSFIDRETNLLLVSRKWRDSKAANKMEGEISAVDVLRVVALSGAVRPSEMELICLAVCTACREGGSYSLVVRPRNACALLRAQASLTRASTTRVSISSSSSSNDISNNQPARAKRLEPHGRVWRLAFNADLPLMCVAWPKDLRVLKFGWAFNRPLEPLLPTSLLEVDLGGGFNRHIEDVEWPPELLKLRFGDRFNRPVELAAWPATLQSLSFGASFNQPIASVEWPAALERLSLGEAFDHPVRGVAWRATSLKTLEFGSAFRQPVDGIGWPSRLKELAFGHCFDQLLETCELPRTLEVLRLSDLCEAGPEGHLLAGLPGGCELRFEEAVLCDGDLLPDYL